MTLSEFKKIHADYLQKKQEFSDQIEAEAKKLRPARVSQYMGECPSYVGAYFYSRSRTAKKLIEIAEAIEKIKEALK